MSARAVLLVFAFVGVAATAACAEDVPRGSVPFAAPDRTQFDEVSPALVTRCGSLDCHGTPYRNLRLFGMFGLRLDPNHKPDTKLNADSEAGQREITANYDAVVALEPEIMTEVVREPTAAHAGRLTLVRKGRGLERHKGGRRLVPDDPADRCLLSWLTGQVDVAACQEVPLEDK
jgi:hypothetical protein